MFKYMHLIVCAALIQISVCTSAASLKQMQQTQKQKTQEATKASVDQAWQQWMDAMKNSTGDVRDQNKARTDFLACLATYRDLPERPFLIEAAEVADEHVVAFLLARGVLPHQADADGNTALHKAAWRADEGDKFIRTLHNQRQSRVPDLTCAQQKAAYDDEGERLQKRCIAARVCQRAHIARLLLEAGASPWQENTRGELFADNVIPSVMASWNQFYQEQKARIEHAKAVLAGNVLAVNDIKIVEQYYWDGPEENN